MVSTTSFVQRTHSKPFRKSPGLDLKHRPPLKTTWKLSMDSTLSAMTACKNASVCQNWSWSQIQSMKQKIDEMEKNTFGHAMISVDGENNLSQQD